MKKSLVLILTLVFILGIVGTAFAANPFTDVPAGHWSYGAVSKLAADGVIDGMGDGTFQGDKTLTRYEFATCIARAIAREDKANATQRALIEKLAAEYKAELEGLGVRVQKLEEKAQKIVITGKTRLRYDGVSNNSSRDVTHINLDLNYVYNIGDGWAVKAESEWTRLLNDPTLSGDDSTMMSGQCEQLYVTDGKHLVVGKYAYKPGYGLSYYAKIQGIQYNIGNKVKTTLNWGHTNSDKNNDQFQAVDIVVPIGYKANVRADYQRVQDGSGGIYSKYYGAGFDTSLGDSFLLQAAASEAKTTTNPGEKSKAYFTTLQYKAADPNIAHSSDVFVGYTKIPANVAYDRSDADDYDYTDDFKGSRTGIHYVPMKNTLLTVWYLTGKTISTNDDQRIFRAQAEFFF